ncbi:MAG: hypothetical protein K2Q03_03490 [Sphingobacteriaceae bacterium]|nr:hypothetical protein [Sphingobacteriaceae bacterium]
METIKKLLSSSENLSSKRAIALLYAIIGCVVFCYLEYHLPDALKIDVFNTVLLFVAGLAGVSTIENFGKKKESENESK